MFFFDHSISFRKPRPLPREREPGTLSCFRAFLLFSSFTWKGSDFLRFSVWLFSVDCEVKGGSEGG